MKKMSMGSHYGMKGPKPIKIGKGGLTNIGKSPVKMEMEKHMSTGKVSPKEKHFKAGPVSKKTFGFGKKPKMGMKGRPLNYGSA